VGLVAVAAPGRRRPQQVDASTPLRDLSLTATEFSALALAVQERVGTPPEDIDADEVDSIADLVDLVEGRASAEVVTSLAPPPESRPATVRGSGAPVRGSTPPVRGADRPSAPTTVRGSAPPVRGSAPPVRSVDDPTRTTSGVSRPRARASGAAPRPQVRSTSAPASAAVEPGVSHGPPIRFIGWRLPHPELDPSDAQFRRQRIGVGKLTGSELDQVRRAYGRAFLVCGSAWHELRSLQENSEDMAVLWNGSIDFANASLGFWFGESVSEDDALRTTVSKIREVVDAWLSGFRCGFRDMLPVFIRRKAIEPVFGDPPARHIARNTIELMPDYFDLTPAQQAVSLLHEMGHWAIGVTAPRDERDDLCSGGWNREENMCYRDVAAITDLDSRFRSGNPRTLAIAADRGSGHALGVALNNIDNYVCWMWNRFNDHQTAVMRLLPPGAKPLPRDGGKPKPGQDPRVGELPPDGPVRRPRAGGKPIPDAGGGKGKPLGGGKPVA
jgi:hypothetical protein